MEVVPACPPGAMASTTTVLSPSEAAYRAAAMPAGPAPMIARSYSPSFGLEIMPSPAATWSTVAAASRVPSGRMHSGSREAAISSGPRS
jgi:hypothetical protein